MPRLASLAPLVHALSSLLGVGGGIEAVLEILLELFVFATWSLPAFMPALENIRSTPAAPHDARPGGQGTGVPSWQELAGRPFDYP